ncbi:MAG: nucleotidyltransferase domain-containing protein [Roseitalea sp.]|nr:nucleotidyltransferase domain-containing protein [Roseitalea sp.]MBO6722546.1 nucleotidyltransferase domain-containing protein [Roseitalea sp.]MBO6742320.1 nucleotidyltransferase domain-containing protein [Roseitalea sp.]
MSTRALIAKLEALKPSLQDEGVEGLVLFGSQARGMAGPGSDIDIAISVAKGSRFSILNLVGVEQLVSDATDLPANAFMLRALDDGFRADINRHGIKVF